MRHVVLLLLLVWPIQPPDASGELPPAEKEWALGANEPRELLATRPDNKREEVLYSESHALLIGEYDYSNGYSKFEHVNDEMLRLGAALRSHNFHVLYYANLPGDLLRQVIEDFAQTYGQIRQGRIVIYLSGHGETLHDVLDDSDPPRKKDVGFFVPVDAPQPARSEGDFRKKALRLSEVVEWTDAMTALHVLVVLDSCYSGIIFQNFKGGPLKEKSDYPPISVFNKPFRNRARLFISAGTAEDKTPDPSNLAIYFTDALEGRRQEQWADHNRDGYLTGEEFYALISAFLPNEPPRTTPRMGYSPITSGWQNGNITFKLPQDAVATSASTSTAASTSTSKSAPVVAPSSSNFVEDYYTSVSSCADCGEAAGTETPITLEMPKDRFGTLSNATLECRGSSCQFSVVVHGPELASDAKSVNATVKTWGGAKATWYMRADVQDQITYITPTVETDLPWQSSVMRPSTPLPLFAWNITPSLNSAEVFHLPLRPSPNYFVWMKQPFDVWPSFPESTTTTTTSTDGTVTTFVPDKTIVIRRVGVTDPVSYVVGKTVRYVNKTGAEIQASKIKPGTRVHVYYDGTGDNRVVSRVVVGPLVTLDIKTFTLHSDSDSFDLRRRLEANEDKARYSARETLSKMLAKMSPEEIGTLIGAMPNSSYRYALGVSEALAKCSGGWYTPNLAESIRIMDRIAAQQGDKALSESIRRAKKNAKPNAGVNS